MDIYRLQYAPKLCRFIKIKKEKKTRNATNLRPGVGIYLPFYENVLFSFLFF